MLESNELVLFILSIPAFVFMMTSAGRGEGEEYRDIWILKLAFGLQVLAWFLTNAEAFFLNEVFNCLEHISECSSAILILLWLVRLLRRGRENAA